MAQEYANLLKRPSRTTLFVLLCSVVQSIIAPSVMRPDGGPAGALSPVMQFSKTRPEILNGGGGVKVFPEVNTLRISDSSHAADANKIRKWDTPNSKGLLREPKGLLPTPGSLPTPGHLHAPAEKPDLLQAQNALANQRIAEFAQKEAQRTLIKEEKATDDQNLRNIEAQEAMNAQIRSGTWVTDEQFQKVKTYVNTGSTTRTKFLEIFRSLRPSARRDETKVKILHTAPTQDLKSAGSLQSPKRQNDLTVSESSPIRIDHPRIGDLPSQKDWNLLFYGKEDA